MPRTHDIDGVIVNVINPALGAGGQGVAEQVALASDPNIGLVVKHIPTTESAKTRSKALADLALPLMLSLIHISEPTRPY